MVDYGDAPFLSGVGVCKSGIVSNFSFLLSLKRLLYDLTTNDTNRTLRLMSEARRHGRRAFKAFMRSHHLKIPKYELPLRFRPVSPPPPSPRPTHNLNISTIVVRRVDVPHHALACLPRPHQPCPCYPTKRQTIALFLPGNCHWSLLLYIRCGGVSRIYHIPSRN